MLVNSLVQLVITVSQFFKDAGPTLITKFLRATYFLPSYFKVNEWVWQEGLLVDFLQKKVFDKWVRRHLIRTNALFNESLLFRRTVDFYWFLINLPSHHTNLFFFNSPVFNFLYALFFFFSIAVLVILMFGWALYGIGLC